MMKRLLLMGMLLVTTLGWGQGFYHDRAMGVQTTNPQGGFIPISYGQVRVCTLPATGSPCTPLASITDVFGNPLSVAGGNFGQVFTDVQGNFNFGCPAGNYEIQIVAQSSNVPQLNYDVTCPTTGAGFVTGVTLNQGLVVTAGTVGLQACGANQVLVENSGATAWVCGSASGAPGNPVGSLQGNSSGTFFGIPNTNFNSVTGQVNIQNFENILFVDQFNWSIAPGGSYSVGSNTLTFAICPRGVYGGDTYANKTPHWVYISGGSGTAEPVAITGGTCPANGSSGGTITFNTVFSHSGAFTVASATGGYQETQTYVTYLKSQFAHALPDYTPYKIVGPLGAVTTFYAPFYVSSGASGNLPYYASFETFEGGSIECVVYANCIQIGDTWQLELLNGTSTNTIGAVSNKFRDLVVGPGLNTWKVNPSAVTCNLGSPGITVITSGSNTCTLTIPTGPTGFYAAIPNQFIYLNGTTNGLEGTYRGTGEMAMVTGGTCANGGAGCTIVIAPGEPWSTTFAGHDAGFSLTAAVNAAFEDNGQGTLFDGIGSSFPTGGVSPAYFGSEFQIDNDQSATITTHNIDVAYQLLSSSEFVGAVVFAPGDFGHYAGISNIEHSSLSEQCQGAMVEWYSGNGLSVSDSIFQGFPLYATKISSNRGGYGVYTYKNVYSEQGGCVDPILGLTENGPDMILNGVYAERYGSNQPANAITTFAGSQSGQTYQTYYIVYTDGGSNKSVPVPIGVATVTNPNTNNITVKWFTGTTAGTAVGGYDLLRVTGTTGGIAASAPTGTGNWAVTTGLVPSAVCNIDGACSYTDTLANGSLTSYTVPATGGPGGGNPNFGPVLSHFATGAIVISGNANTVGNAVGAQGMAGYYGVAACVTAPVLAQQPVATFNDFSRYGITSGAGPCLASGKGQTFLFTLIGSQGSASGGTALPDVNAGAGTFAATSPLTGRLNFGENRNNTMHDVITIADYNIDATEAVNQTGGGIPYRRALIANDAGIGMDGANSNTSDMMLHAGDALDFYVGLPSGVSCGTNCWMRLTGTTATIKVPTTITGAQPQLNLGANGGTGGQLGLLGATSGTATLSPRCCWYNYQCNSFQQSYILAGRH